MGAPLPPVPFVAMIRVYMDLAGHTCENVFHYRFGNTVPTDSDMGVLANTVFERYQLLFTSGSDWISSDLSLQKVTATYLGSPTGAFAEFDNGGVPVPGDATQQASAPVAMLIRKKVAARYRGGHGRTYLVGFTDDNNLNGRVWKPAALAAGLAFWNALIADIHSATYPNITPASECIVSYYDRNLNPVKPYRRTVPVTYDVTEYLVDSVLRSQRRRVRLTPTPT